jgi:hypothetical protein
MLQRSFMDTLINIDVLLPKGEGDALVKVTQCSVDSNGKVIGEFNENPLLNTILYECEFEDGTAKEYTANMIASNIFQEMDADGYSSLFLYYIINHMRSSNDISMEDEFFVTKSGTKRMGKTTVGWKLLVQCTNGSHQWIAFSESTTQIAIQNPDSHPILLVWQDETGPRLWHFPLTAEATNPQDETFATAPQPPIPTPAPLLAPPPRITRLTPPASTVILPAVSVSSHPHPSQSVLATDTFGIACLVYYLYGAAQAVALAARAAGTPFDSRSLDLPSIGALVGFYHACLGFPVKQTLLNAIKAGNCDTFKGLTYSNAAKYCPDADEMIMGHLAQQRQNVRSTKAKLTSLPPLVVLPPPIEAPSNQVFVATKPLSKLFTDNTGIFPIQACSSNQYVMIAFHAKGNLILQQAFKSKSGHHCIAAYNTIMMRLAAQGLSVDLQILDNKASAAYKEAITFKWNATFQLVPPDMHCCNQAECTIRTFKDHFLAILAGVDSAFPPYL